LVESDTGESEERRLEHREEAEKFYRDLATRLLCVRVGMEASGQRSASRRNPVPDTPTLQHSLDENRVYSVLL
jgi:hypothetical protein